LFHYLLPLQQCSVGRVVAAVGLHAHPHALVALTQLTSRRKETWRFSRGGGHGGTTVEVWWDNSGSRENTKG
jgi:hypothetical protein